MRVVCRKYADDIADTKILIPPAGRQKNYVSDASAQRYRFIQLNKRSASVLQHDRPIGTDAI